VSNALAVPTVTAAIISLLQSAMDAAAMTHTPTVAAGSLDDANAVPRVVVHLYNVERNAHLDNQDLPTRSYSGVLTSKPRTALRLHYLILCRGTDDFESQRMIGIAAAALHAKPVLDRDLVTAVVSSTAALAGSDLAQAHEPVRVTPEAVSVDEQSRLWALYTVGLFGATLAYAASPVIVEADETPTTALPVAAFAVGARPLLAPRLDSVAGPAGPGAPIRAATAQLGLTLLGAALAPQAGENLVVEVDGVALAPASVTVVSDNQIDLSGANQTPGVHSVVVSRLQEPVDPSLSTTRPALRSLPVTYAVTPSLLTATATTTSTSGTGGSVLATGHLDATVAPSLTSTQRVRLVLDSTTLDPPVAVTLSVTITAPTTAISAEYTDVPADTYRVSLVVDGFRNIPPWAGGTYTLAEVAL
jgi:hypothetical protein